jgi:hypothetical protein
MATDVPGITHRIGFKVNFLIHRISGNTTETINNCPISIPILNDKRDAAIWFVSNLISDKIPAKPNPWINPNQRQAMADVLSLY